ncbi:MAG: hypothetical protein IJ548_08595 [Paludibacteraceae bacterium]|nr:hypothetical protein [Paludibacteraceae bacterium]MBQ8714975.1 hypothetical protein [Prevotella sp.]
MKTDGFVNGTKRNEQNPKQKLRKQGQKASECRQAADGRGRGLAETAKLVYLCNRVQNTRRWEADACAASGRCLRSKMGKSPMAHTRLPLLREKASATVIEGIAHNKFARESRQPTAKMFVTTLSTIPLPLVGIHHHIRIISITILIEIVDISILVRILFLLTNSVAKVRIFSQYDA